MPADTAPPSPEPSPPEPPRLHLTPARQGPRELKLWHRYVLAGTVAVVLLVAMVIYVEHHNTDSPPSSNPAAAVQANREAEQLVRQDQAPRSVPAAAGLSPRAAIVHAIRSLMARKIATGAIDGPIERAACSRSPTGSASRTAFTCVVDAGHVNYPFVGVVDTGADRVIYCKRDPPPAPSDNVPVSSRCTS